MELFFVTTALMLVCCCFLMTLWIIKKLLGI